MQQPHTLFGNGAFVLCGTLLLLPEPAAFAEAVLVTEESPHVRTYSQGFDNPAATPVIPRPTWAVASTDLSIADADAVAHPASGTFAVSAFSSPGIASAYALQYVRFKVDRPSRITVKARLSYVGGTRSGLAGFAGTDILWDLNGHLVQITEDSAFDATDLLMQALALLQMALFPELGLLGFGLDLASNILALDVGDERTVVEKERVIFAATAGMEYYIGFGMQGTAVGGLSTAHAAVIGVVERIEISAESGGTQVDVTVKNATGVPNTVSIEWFSKPDPYVKVYTAWRVSNLCAVERDLCNISGCRTSTEWDTTSPVWDEILSDVTQIPTEDLALEFRMWDEDPDSADEEIVVCPGMKWTPSGDGSAYYPDQQVTGGDIALNFDVTVLQHADATGPPDERPVAIAMSDRTLNPFQEFQFHGIASHDGEGGVPGAEDIARYEWRFQGGPFMWTQPGPRAWEGGRGALQVEAPPFAGIYRFQLILWDNAGQQSVAQRDAEGEPSDILHVTVTGRRPVARATAERARGAGETIHFSGDASSDPDGDQDICFYRWELGPEWPQQITTPWMRWAQIVGNEITGCGGCWERPAPNAPGTYTATLHLKDSQGLESIVTAESSVTVTVVPDVLKVDVWDDADNGQGYNPLGGNSLRKCIRLANEAGGHRQIVFTDAVILPIQPTSGAYTLRGDSIIINASGRWAAGCGGEGKPGVQIDGSQAGPVSVAFNLSGVEGCEIRGLEIINYGTGVYIDKTSHHNTIGGEGPGERNVIAAGFSIDCYGSDNRIVGNYIGTGLCANTVRPTQAGVRVGGLRNLVGGRTAEARNIIFGESSGVVFFGSGNILEGNYVGTDASGMIELETSKFPLSVHVSGDDNRIGGPDPSQRNVIATQSTCLTIAGGLRNVVQNNYLGLAADGVTPLGDGMGIWILDGAQENLIGGPSSSFGNVIAGGHTAMRIAGEGTERNRISANRIGTDASGTVLLTQALVAVSIELDAADNVLGGTSAGEGNLIAGKSVQIAWRAHGNAVLSNIIGTNVNGSEDWGTSAAAVYVRESNANTIDSNELARHASGVRLRAGSGNRISRNRMHDNDGAGILLEEGANGSLRAPVLETVVWHQGNLWVAGTTTTPAGTVEVFDTEAANTTQGMRFIGEVECFASGRFSGRFDLGESSSPEFVTATVTDAGGSTSAFPAAASAPAPLSGDIVNPDFEQDLGGWFVFSRGPFGGPMIGDTSVKVVEDGKRKAAEVRRTGSDGKGATLGIFQNVEIDIRGFSTVRFVVDVKVLNQSLEGGGFQGEEYPAHIHVVYEDEYGASYSWSEGLYVVGTSVGENPSTRIKQNEWVAHTSTDFAGLMPRAAVIRGIRLFGNGWDYTSRFTAARLVTGSETGLQAPSDCNQDGELDISDGICLLGHLFLGSPASLPCGDGKDDHPGNRTLADGNGDGQVDLSDGVYIFSFLFLGGPPPVLGLDCVVIEDCPSACSH